MIDDIYYNTTFSKYIIYIHNFKPIRTNFYFSIYRENLLCDVKLIAEGVEVPAHKMVLAACSPYFQAMFISFEESKQERIVLKGLDPLALKALIDYVYSCEILVTEDNVQVRLSHTKLLTKILNIFIL